MAARTLAEEYAKKYISQYSSAKQTFVMRPDLMREIDDPRVAVISRSHKPRGCRRFEIVTVFFAVSSFPPLQATRDCRDFSIACSGEEISMQIAAVQHAVYDLERKHSGQQTSQ